MRCDYVDFFGDWGDFLKAVRCALKYIVAGTRGRVISVNAVKLSRVLFGGDPPAPIYGAALLAAVEEVACECIVDIVKKANGRKRHMIILDVACLKRRLFGEET